jgi:hypothetical protein
MSLNECGTWRPCRPESILSKTRGDAMTVVKVTSRERAAAQLLLELDKRDGRETDPRVEAIANAKWPVTAPADVVEPVIVVLSDDPSNDAEVASQPRIDLDLTPEERRVLELISRGMGRQEIAATLGLTSEATAGEIWALLARIATWVSAPEP